MSRFETAVIRFLIAMLGGCWHFNLTFPQTDRRTKHTTQTCTSCGKTWLYDWATMKRGREVSVFKPETKCPTLDITPQEEL